MRRLVREQVNWSIVLAQSLTRARAVLIRAGYAEDEATKLVTDAADRGYGSREVRRQARSQGQQPAGRPFRYTLNT